MASITKTENIAGLEYTDGSNKITVTAEGLRDYNLQQSDPSLPQYLNTGDCEYEEYYSGTTKVGYVVKGMGDVKNPALSIRSEYNGFPVVGIADYAFHANQTIKSIIIPKSVTFIGERAFGSSTLISVSIAEDTDGDEQNPTTYMVVYFENPGWDTPYVYYSYADNTKFTVGYGVKMTRMGTTNLYSCKVPINTNTISFNAGTDKIKTETLDIGAEVESMSNCMFKTTLNNTADGVTIYKLEYEKFSPPAINTPGYNAQEHNGLVIKDRAFIGCVYMTELALPRRVVSIGNEAFKSCNALTEISIPTQHRLITIGRSAFESCRALNEAKIPDGLNSIGESAFRDCRKLWYVPEASTLRRIGSYAFYNCPEMGTINIGGSVNYIGMNAFSMDEEVKIPNSVRYAIFADTQTWFVATDENIELDLEPQVIPPTSMYGTEVTGAGNTSINAARLGVTYKDYYWHKLKKMVPPSISLNGNNLSMTDRLGVAEYFYVYLNDDYSKPKLIVPV